MTEKFESKFLMSDEEILNKGINKNDIEYYRRKIYQVFYKNFFKNIRILLV
jgi:hypothetical protein